MRAAVLIGSGVPNPATGGGALTAYTTIKYLIDSGHEVVVVPVHDVEYFDPADQDAESRIAHLRAIGAEVVPVPSGAGDAFRSLPRDVRNKLRRAMAPEDIALYPYLVDAERTRDAVASASVDVAFVYHFEGLAASRLLTVPRVVGVGDPSHLVTLYRWRDAWPSLHAVRELPRLATVLRSQPPLMTRMLRECASSGAFAAHHAAWLAAHGVPGCEYLRTPVPDGGGTNWRERRDAVRDDTFHILLLGHLRGVVTIDGLRVFADLLPLLEQEVGRPFVIDVVGGYDPPPELAGVFEHPAVRRHGHVDENAAAEWLRRADVLLVPTSIPLGIRVRVISGFSAGAAIVTHTANSCGTPELQHEQNALLGHDAAELAAQVGRIARGEQLRRTIEAGARSTWEEHFAPPVAAGRIATLLEEAAA